MNSSTSTSKPRPGVRWRRLLMLYGAWVPGVAVVLAAPLLALDPYDTGRFALFGEHGVPNFGMGLNHASFARQPRFDTALLGNSTLQLLEPERLDALSGRSVVNLSVPAAGPLEQLAQAEWFRRHHPGSAMRGLIIGLDLTWCRADGQLPIHRPFPLWLYAERRLDYALGLMRFKSLDAATSKIRLLLGLMPPARADGYDYYEGGRVWDAEAVHRRIERRDADEPLYVGETLDFAALPRLRQFLARLPAETSVVLVMPPRHERGLPAPGTAAALNEEACKAAFQALAAEHPALRVLDFRFRPGMTGDEAFWDMVHFRGSVARAMEPEIAAALKDPTQHGLSP